MGLRNTTSNSRKEHASGDLPRCLTVDMTRRILTTLTAIGFVLLAFASPHSAQERQVGGTSTGDGAQDNRLVAQMAEAEKLRGDLIALYDESEALLSFLAGYEVIRQSSAMKNYDAIRQKLVDSRKRIEQMSAAGIISQASRFPDEQSINRTIKLSQKIRTDGKLQDLIQRTQGFARAGLQRKEAPSAKGDMNSRGVIAAPAYIPPTCNYDDPSAYPSGVDVGILGGIGIALHAVADALPGEIEEACTMIPFIPHIIASIAAGVFDQYKNLVDTGSADAAYCEKVRFFIEDKLKDDRGLPVLWINDDFYLTFMLKSVRASLSAASGGMVPTNCGDARLMEAEAYFTSDVFSGTGPQRVEAYRKLRAAYQNIGAASCVQ